MHHSERMNNMDNLFRQNEISVSFDVMERTNPIFNTAKTTIFLLASSGNDDAKLIASKLGLSLDTTQNSGTHKTTQDTFIASMIVLETRYRTMNTLAEKSSCDSDIDLPCGYAARALSYPRKGKRFIGLDLPAVIQEVKPEIMSLIDEDERDFVRLSAVDATNYDSLEKALKDIDGTFCIITEGLLMYFTDSELTAITQNIRKILAEHGGCWITSDPELLRTHSLISKALTGGKVPDSASKAVSIFKEKSDALAGKLGNSVCPRIGCTDFEEAARNGIKFFESHGFKVERLIFSENMPELNAYSMLKPEQAAAVKEAMTHAACWKLTLTEKPKPSNVSSTGEKFGINAEIKGDILSLNLAGRVDTITAPELLAFWEKVNADHEINAVKINCDALEYISSAGLRVLLIMHKDSKEGVELSDVNSTVRDILTQTGFDSLFKILG